MKKTNLIFLCVLIVIFLSFFSQAIKKPVKAFFIDHSQKAAAGLGFVGKSIDKTFAFIGDIGRLRQENNSLVDKITSLEVDKSEIADLELENKTLKEELGFTEANGVSGLIPAKITMREPTAFLDNFIVDKGKNNGVKVDAAVLSGGTLIGQISEVYDNSSKVTLTTSKDSLIQAMLQNSRSKGILRGGVSGLYLEDVTQDTEYQAGEYVVTSGLDGKMKEGILIGKAGQVQPTASGIFKNINVDPIVDMTKLELVFISK